MERETSALIDFIDRSPSPYHAVANAKAMLRGAGFEELDERRRFSIKEGGSYFVERNGSALIAFRIPEGASAFSIVAAHTDSPVLHIKPDPEYDAQCRDIRRDARPAMVRQASVSRRQGLRP